MAKILVFTNSFFPNMGGLERNSLTLCNNLTQLDHSVKLLTRTSNNETDNFNFKVIRSKNLLDLIKLVIWADLVLINGGISKPICIISLLFKRRFVPLYVSAEPFFIKSKKAKNYTYKYLFRRAHFHITLSIYTKSLINRTNCAVLYNPIDNLLENCLKAVENKPKKYDCLYLGRIVEGKGIFLLAEALSILNNRGIIDPTLAIAGVGEDQDQFLKKLEENGVRYIYLGKLDGQELIETYLNAKVTIIPSSTHIEGNPLVLAESISCLTPAIVSNQPAMVETIQKSGLVFESGNVQDLADKIERVLNNEDLYIELKESCRTHREMFTSKKYKIQLEKIINQCLA